jgi:hypothetical protein
VLPRNNATNKEPMPESNPVNTLEWSEPRQYDILGKPQHLRTATPNAAFWDYHKQHKKELYAQGYTVKKIGGRWLVQHWTAI